MANVPFVCMVDAELVDSGRLKLGRYKLTYAARRRSGDAELGLYFVDSGRLKLRVNSSLVTIKA